MSNTVVKNFLITEKGLNDGYTSDFFSKDASDINRHNYCNDSAYIYISTNWENRAPVGIGIMATLETIEWYVKYWIERGILEPVD